MSKEIPYPIVIVDDRYNGAYSNGSFLAFNLDVESVMELDIDGDDSSCFNFWNDLESRPEWARKIAIGKGNNPNEALNDLIKKLKEIEGNYIETGFKKISD